MTASTESDLAALSTAEAIDPALHLIYLPPWRERLASGKLGPFYGPLTLSSLKIANDNYHASRDGGGLWDDEEDARTNPRTATRVARRTRYDEERVSRYVRLHSADIPMREMAVYLSYYRDGRTLGQTARVLGMRPGNVREALHVLRKRTTTSASPCIRNATQS